MDMKFLCLVLIVFVMSTSSCPVLSETGGGTKIDCTILTNEGGNKTLLPSGNIGTVGKDVILGCMGLPGAFTGDSSLTLSGSTGNDSIANIFPFQNNLGVNPDGSTEVANFSIMILSSGNTDIAVDFAGNMNFDVNSTLWTFQEPSSGGSDGSSMSGSSTSSGGTQSSSGSVSTTSSGGSSDICSAAITQQCKAKKSRKECRACCGSVVAISSSDICKAKCLKKCKKSKR